MQTYMHTSDKSITRKYPENLITNTKEKFITNMKEKLITNMKEK